MALDRFLSLEIEPAAQRIFQEAVLEHAKACRHAAGPSQAGFRLDDPDRKQHGDVPGGGDHRNVGSNSSNSSNGTSSSTPTTAANSDDDGNHGDADAADDDAADADAADADAPAAAASAAAATASVSAVTIDGVSDRSPSTGWRSAARGVKLDTGARRPPGLPRGGHDAGGSDNNSLWSLPGRPCRTGEEARSPGENQDMRARARLVTGLRDPRTSATSRRSGGIALAEAPAGGCREGLGDAGAGAGANAGGVHGKDSSDVKGKTQEEEEGSEEELEDNGEWDVLLPGGVVRKVLLIICIEYACFFRSGPEFPQTSFGQHVREFSVDFFLAFSEGKHLKREHIHLKWLRKTRNERDCANHGALRPPTPSLPPCVPSPPPRDKARD